MISKNKRILMVTMSVSASIIPAIAITSCGSSIVDDSKFIIESKTNPKVRIFDVKDNNYWNINTLLKIFDGISQDNINHLDVSVIGNNEVYEGSTHQIVLSAKEGYSINDLETLTSNEFTLLPNVFEYNSIKDVQVNYNHNELTHNLINNIDFLKNIFNGMQPGDLDNLKVSLEHEDFSYTITLNAKDDFYFLVNGEKVKFITSHPFTTLNINLIITKKNNPIIIREDMINGNYKSLRTLEKLFNDINQSDLENMTVEIDNQSNVKIILIANEGYLINGEKEFSSDFFSVSIILDITPKTEDPKDITHVDLQNDGYKSIEILEKLFNGINKLDLLFMDVTVSNKLPNEDFIPYDDYIIIIKPKNGYIFLDNFGRPISELNSFTFRTVDVIYDIEALPNPILDNADITPENYNKLFVLQKLFIGEKDLTEENLKNIDILINRPTDINDNYYTFTIHINEPGFLFSNGLSLLDSEGFILKTIINITPKQNLSSELPNHLELLDLVEPYFDDYYRKLEILEKLFSGVKLEDIYNIIEIITLEEPVPGLNKQKVTLVASLEYAFIYDGKEVDQISSIEFVTNPVILNIEPTYITKLNSVDIEDNNYQKLSTLHKLFYGVEDLTEENLRNMDVQLITPDDQDNYYKIILIVSEGYIFQYQENQVESGQFILV
ncbi:MAG: hypothetical protein ACRCWU_03085 [Metamycoplasmataceae bacterium]